MTSLEGMAFMARYAVIIPLGLISSEAAGAGTVIVVTSSCRILAHLLESIACYFYHEGMDISPLVRSCLTIPMRLSSPSSTNDNISEVIKTAPCEAKEINPKHFALSFWHLSCPNSTSAQQRPKIECFWHSLLLLGVVPFILRRKGYALGHISSCPLGLLCRDGFLAVDMPFLHVIKPFFIYPFWSFCLRFKTIFKTCICVCK